MIFRVSYKGITKYLGRLDAVADFIEKHWGSPQLAADLGVKVEPAPTFFH